MPDSPILLPPHANDQPRFLTELPFGLPGRVFRCPMPFSPYDPHGHALQAFRELEISVIALLAETDECVAMTGRELLTLYRQVGFRVLHLPIRDGGVPLKPDLEHLTTAIIQCAQGGQHVAIHCYAGIGRTGLVAAALAQRLLDIPGDAAIAWVRRYIPRAVETPAQRQLLVDDYEE